MRQLWSILLVLALASPMAVACGGDDENNDTTDAGDTSADAGDTGDGGDVDEEPDPEPFEVNHSFSEGEAGWESDVADYRVGNEGGVAFRGELRSLPAELNEEGAGYYLDALNPSGSVFPFIRKQLTEEDGVFPNTEYEVRWRIRFATNLATDCSSNPGTEMWMKAGATTYKPAVIDRDMMRVLNYDKGEGQIGGPAATVLGDVAHDGDCEGLDREDFIPQVNEGRHRTTVESDEDGNLWLLAGVDVDVSSSISIYIIRVEVAVTPVTPE